MTTPHDVFPPPKDAPYDALSKGYTYDIRSISVFKACSKATMHGLNTWEYVDRPHAIALYSSPYRAALGMRDAVIIKHRLELEKVDKYIRKLERKIFGQ